ncbi:MAG: hypothetical protein ACM3NT_03280 [Methylocystaceae bacterium]
MFHTIDSAYLGPYPLRIEEAISQQVNQLHANNPDHFVVLATHYTPENGVDFNSRWPRVYTLLQREDEGDFQITFCYRNDNDDLITLAAWTLLIDELQLAWLSYPYED